MPWLVKDKEDPTKSLLFVHVPRCGGTSLTKYFNVPKKSRQGKDPWHWFGMLYFFYRYQLLETQNYPLITIENGIFLIEYIIAIVLISIGSSSVAQYTLFATGGFMFLLSTFIATAPVIGRNQFMRRFYGELVGRVLCNFMGNNEWLTGTSHLGFLVHFTAAKMLKHDLVTPEELDKANSFAIVRNPYSRMVSIYMYNRMGPLESFDHFARDWVKNKLKKYRETRSTEEWDTYCHAVPAFEYTHLNGQQIVKSIIKQEELSKLWCKASSKRSKSHEKRLHEIPEPVAAALQGMPHTNQRKRSKPWWDYYTQETQDLVAEAYAADFFYFGYDTRLPNRPDLKAPNINVEDFRSIRPFSSNLDFSIYNSANMLEIAKKSGSKSISTTGTFLEPVQEATESLELFQASKADKDSLVIELAHKGDSTELHKLVESTTSSAASATSATSVSKRANGMETQQGVEVVVESSASPDGGASHVVEDQLKQQSGDAHVVHTTEDESGDETLSEGSDEFGENSPGRDVAVQ